MRTYKGILDVETEDKVFGGKLTFRQMMYLGADFVYYFFAFYLNPESGPIVLIAKIVWAIAIAIVTLAFTFVKKDIYYLDKYLIKKFHFERNRRPAVYSKF